MKKDCSYAMKGQPPSGTGKGMSSQGGKGKGKGKNKDDTAQPECFRCGKTGRMKKDCRSVRHKDGHNFPSVAEKEPEEEAGDLTSLCAVEHMGNNG